VFTGLAVCPCKESAELQKQSGVEARFETDQWRTQQQIVVNIVIVTVMIMIMNDDDAAFSV
jgi:hypothetical protein